MVSPVALCGYHMFRQGGRPGARVCRKPATHVLFWLDALGDLYLCPSHAAAMVKRHPDDGIELERVAV